MLGKTLSRYRIVDKLGEGGMGEVYRAEDTLLKRQVALKVLPPDLAASQERLERFQREAEALAALDHPAIVTIYSVEEAEGVHFLTMQLVEGRPLSELIPRRGMSLTHLFEISVPLADALAVAHAKGVIHRDLKPANIMVGDDGRVKILDFGLAKLRQELTPQEFTQVATEPLTQEGRIVGTVPYMSPEQLEGKAIDARTDIFSLGVLLYQMATGERPFQGDTSLALISAIVKDSPREVDVVRAEVPHHLARIIRHCLEKDPDRRFQAAKDVRNELDDLRREGETRVLEPAAAEPRPPRTRWWPAIAGLVLAAVAGTALWLAQGRGPAAMDSVDAEHARPMIVVLPFENLGPAEDNYFTDGMTEEITSRLASVSGLGVISRTSALQYRDERPPIRQIGEELGVDYVLEGTVRWQKTAAGPSRVRITPQLIRVTDDVHLWSNRYDRTLDEIFAVQSSVAEEVIRQLGVELREPERLAIEARPTDNLEAYEAYLRGVDRLNDADWYETNHQVAAQMFARAVDLDPDFALAHAGLARADSVLYWEKWDASDERAAEARLAAHRAIELAPRLPEGHLAMGSYRYYVERDYEGALDEFRLAQEALPDDPRVPMNIGAVLRRQGRFEEAAEQFETALQLDPRSTQIPWVLGQTYTTLRRYEQAENAYARSLSVAPDQERAYYYQAFNRLLWTGDLAAAREPFARIPKRQDPKSFAFQMHVKLCARDYAAALKTISRAPAEFTWEAESKLHRGLWQALIHQLMDEPARARSAYEAVLPRLERAVAEAPGLPGAHSNLGWAYAGLGRSEEAVRHGRRAVELLPIARDAYSGAYFVELLALIHTMVGDDEAALEGIETLLSNPAWVSVPLLELDPRWDQLRDRPRFRQLLETHGQEGAAGPGG